MTCAKCKVNALKEALLARHPDGNIPPAESKPLIDACLACSHGCLDAKGRPRCPHYNARRDGPDRVERAEAALASADNALDEARERAASKPALYAFAVSVKEKAAKSAARALAAEKAKYAAACRACATCSRSADDNPSNHGKIFSTLAALDDDAQPAASDAQSNCPNSVNWLFSRASANNRLSHAPDYPDGCSALPPEIEDKWRLELTQFSEAPLVTKFLVCFLMTRKDDGNYYTLADFANLKWLKARDAAGNLHDTDFARFLYAAGYRLAPTKEFNEQKRSNPSLKPHVSKQAIHFRFKTLLKRMPTLAAIASGTLGRNAQSRVSRRPNPQVPAKPSPQAQAKRKNAPPKHHKRTQVRIQQDLFDTSFDAPVAPLRAKGRGKG